MKARIDEVRHDVTFAIRQMRRAPAFTAIAAITLALGLGANSAIFALVDATLLRPLPLPQPDRLVMVWEHSDTIDRGLLSPLNLFDLNEGSRTFEKMAGFVPRVGGMVMAGADGTAETVPRQWVTSGVFDVLGIRPVAGRTFRPADETQQLGAVVLSEAFWRTRFNGDRTIVGSAVRLDGEPFTVVGVVPQEAQLLGATSIWALAAWDRSPGARAPRILQVIGRLKPDVSLEAAGSDMSILAEGLAREFPATNRGRGVMLEPMRDALIGSELRLTSMLFLGVVGFVLLICCANVANLLLARATARARELAVRTALGASRRRVVRQLLTESLVLSSLGGLLGVAVGVVILEVAPSLVPPGLLPGAVTLAFDARVAAFCVAAALLVGLLFGLAPVWQARALSLAQVGNSRTSTGGGGTIRGLLVVGAVAAATLLLCGAGLLLRTLAAVEDVDRGYRADDVLTMLVDPLGSEYPTAESLQQFFDGVEREVMAVPGVRSVAWASTLPMGMSIAGPVYFEVVGDAPVDPNSRPTADYQVVSHTYFQTVDLPVVAGRAFTDRDRRDSVPVCLVNEEFADRYLQGRSPIGVRVALREAPSAPATVREIVGVARQVKGRPDEAEGLVQVYVPMPQSLMGDILLLVRPASGRADVLAPSVRAAIGRIDRAQLVSIRDVMTLEDVRTGATARHRFRAVLVMMFAGLALVLAMVGVFGILASSVQQRVREIGVRMALGAGLVDVLGTVVGSALGLVAAGVAIGLAMAAGLGQLLATVLFGVQPLDPPTFGTVVIVLTVTAAMAAATPAWRAAHVDPAVALRCE